MPRAALSPDAVVDCALRIIDEDGASALTLAAVAGRAGVASPSLYKHVRNLAELRDLVSIRVTNEISEQMSQAVLGRAGDDALRELMCAWRAYVLRHPNRYAAVNQAPDPAMAAAGGRFMGILFAALRAYGLEDSSAVHAARCVRSAVHGFAGLEASGAFGLPEDLDESYDLLIRMITSGVAPPATP